MDSGGIYEIAVAEAMELRHIWNDKEKRKDFIERRSKELGKLK
jgi:hypothetical protein